MRSIVVPVNFSPNSANAARYAVDLALATGADIHLIYVFQVPISVTEIPMAPSVFEELRDSGLELLQSLAGELRKRAAGKVSITTDMETNSVERRIEQFCEAKRPFLVIMGASGDSLENVLAGSNTVKALRYLNYPLLVIPETAAYKPIRKIVVAFDREDIFGGMPAVLPFLQDLNHVLGAELEVLHVLTNGEESASEATAEYNSWKNEVKGLSTEMHFIRRPQVSQGISDYLAEHHADWLMVFPKNHSWLEFHKSRAKQIVEHVAVPVISLHE